MYTYGLELATSKAWVQIQAAIVLSLDDLTTSQQEDRGRQQEDRDIRRKPSCLTLLGRLYLA